MADAKKIKVTLVKGVSRTTKGHRETVRGLGLKWTNHTVEVVDLLRARPAQLDGCATVNPGLPPRRLEPPARHAVASFPSGIR